MQNDSKGMTNSLLKKNTVFNIIKTVSTVIFPLIIFPYTSRVLGPENIGKVNFANSIVSYASLVASLGIGSYAVRECAKVKHNTKDLSLVGSQLFTINLVSTIFAYTMLLIAVLLNKKLQDNSILILILSIPIAFQTFGADWLNTAMEDLRFISMRTMLFQVVSIVAIIALVKGENDYFTFAVISVVASIGANCLNIYHRKNYCAIKIVKNFGLNKHAKPIFFLFVLTLSQTIFLNVDTTMIGFFLGDVEVGVYSVAVKIYNLASTLISAITIVVIPQLSYYSSIGDDEAIKNIQKYALNYILTIGVPIIVGINVITPGIIELIAGPAYNQAEFTLRILSAALIMVMLGGAFIGNIVLIPSGREKIFTHATLIATAVNFCLNLFFIPRYGIVAAAFTTVFSEAIILIISFWGGKKYIKVKNVLKSVITPAIGVVPFPFIALALSAVIHNTVIHAVITVLTCSVTYFLVEMLLKNEFFNEFIGSTFKKRS